MSKKLPNGGRVFIGIKVTDEIARQFTEFQGDLVGLPARIINPADMHLTLVPPWRTPDWTVVESQLKKILADIPRFTIEFELVEYGPTLHRPRLLWVTGAP